VFLSRRRPASARGHHTPGRAQPRRSADARLPPLTAPVSVDRPVRCCDRGVWRRWRRGTGVGLAPFGRGRPRVPCPPRDAAAPARPAARIPLDDGARCSFELAGMQDGPPVRYRTRSLTEQHQQDSGPGRRDPRRRARGCEVLLFFLLYYYLEIKHGALVVGCRAQRNRDGRCGAACASSLVTRRARLRQCECPLKRPRPPSRSGRPRGKRPIQRIQRSERARGAPVGRSRC